MGERSDTHGLFNLISPTLKGVAFMQMFDPFRICRGKAVAALPLPLRKASGFPRLALHIRGFASPAVDEAEPQIKKKSVGKP